MKKILKEKEPDFRTSIFDFNTPKTKKRERSLHD